MEILKVASLAELVSEEGRDDLRTMCEYGWHEGLSPEELTHILKLCDCFWQHAGEGTAPHAELTSGKHSDGFVNVLVALKYPVIMEVCAVTLARQIEDALGGVKPTWCIGSDHAAAVLSQRVAYHLDIQCADFTEKAPDEVDAVTGKKTKVQIWNRHRIEPGKVVLQVEELITTAATTDAVHRGVTGGNFVKFGVEAPVEFATVMGALVNRSTAIEQIAGMQIVAPGRYRMHEWDPDDCPLCKGGSKAIKPKQGDNWALLKATGR